MVRRVFVAGPGLERDRAKEVGDVIATELSVMVYPWWGCVGFDEQESFDRFARIKTAVDIEAFIRECDTVVWVVGDKPSQGAPYEVGFARALGKRVLVYCPREFGRNEIYPERNAKDNGRFSTIGHLLDEIRNLPDAIPF